MKGILKERNNNIKTGTSASLYDCPGWKLVKKPKLEKKASRPKVLKDDIENVASGAGALLADVKDTQNAATGTEALSTDLVLQCVFKYLGSKDLQNCRLVTRKWNQVASSTLKRKRLSVNNGRFLKRSPNQTLSTNLSDVVSINFHNLIHCVENSPNFPFTGLHFCGWFWKVNSVNAKTYFRAFGDRITRLSLNTNFQSASPLVQLLQKHLPNVEELEVFEVGNFARMNGTSKLLEVKGKRISLPALKVLILHHNGYMGAGKRCFCEEVIRSAPRLQRIENFHCALTGAVMEAGKMAAVASLHFTPNRSHLLHYKNFSAGAPELKTMTIEKCEEIDDFSTNEACELGDALFSILSSSIDSLHHLRTAPLRIMKGTRLPELKNLRSLHIVHDIDRMTNVTALNMWNSYPIFPSDTQISATFPALHKIRLQLQAGIHSFLDHYFVDNYGGQRTETVPTVQVLELSCKFDAAGMAMLMKLFPNIIHIRMDWIKCFEYRATPVAWCLPPKLQKLDLHGFRFPWDKAGNAVNVGVATDSFFTGIPEEICSNLRAVRKVCIDPAILRTQPSVSTLPELRELNVSFSYSGIVALRLLSKGPLMSPIIGWYGFSVMPDLRVRFLYDYHHDLADDMAAILQPVAPFVTFDHCESSRQF